jgi:hypothetical protein
MKTVLSAYSCFHEHARMHAHELSGVVAGDNSILAGAENESFRKTGGKNMNTTPGALFVAPGERAMDFASRENLKSCSLLFCGGGVTMAGLGLLPQHLQLKVLGMLDEHAFNQVVDSAAATGKGKLSAERQADSTFLSPIATCFTARRAAEDLKGRGLAVFDNFLGASVAANTRAAADEVAESGVLRKAHMGKDGTKWADTRARGDDMIWWSDLCSLVGAETTSRAKGAAEGDDSTGASGAQLPTSSIEHLGKVVTRLQSVGSEVSKEIGKQFECNRMTFQLARYADGARYVRHSDVSEKTPDRRITCIYYMNSGWKKDDGGVLRLYLRSSHGTCEPYDVAPLMDRLILFRSEVSCVAELPPSARLHPSCLRIMNKNAE